MGKPVSPNKNNNNNKIITRLTSCRSPPGSAYCHVRAFGPSQASVRLCQGDTATRTSSWAAVLLLCIHIICMICLDSFFFKVFLHVLCSFLIYVIIINMSWLKICFCEGCSLAVTALESTWIHILYQAAFKVQKGLWSFRKDPCIKGWTHGGQGLTPMAGQDFPENKIKHCTTDRDESEVSLGWCCRMKIRNLSIFICHATHWMCFPQTNAMHGTYLMGNHFCYTSYLPKLLIRCISDFDYIVFFHHILKWRNNIRLISNSYN